MVKFLIIRFSSIGDIVLTTPVVRCLKNQVEGAEIHYLTKTKFAGLLQHNPYIDKVWTFDNNLGELLQSIRETHIDYIIDLHHNLRTQRIKNRLRILSFSFNKLNYAKWLMVNFKVNKLPDVHIVDRYLDTVALFGVKNDGQGLDYFPSHAAHELPEDVSTMLPREYIALVIGAQHYTKKLPTEKLAELVDNLDKPAVILGGPGDEIQAGEILSQSRQSNIVNLAGKISLDHSALIIKNAGVVITHDTGLMHIAAAYGKKVLSVWGNTIPGFGMYPYQAHPSSRIFEVNGLSCRPCSKIGFQECPKKHFRCMRDQDMVAMARYANSLFRSNPQKTAH